MSALAHHSFSKLKRVASGSLAVIGTRLLGAGVGFLTQFLLVKLMGSRELGIFYAASSLSAVLGVIVSQGYPQIAPRFVGRYRNKRNNSLMGAFAGHAIREGLLLALAAAIGVTIWSLARPGLGQEERIAFAIAGWSLLAVASLNITTNIAGGMRAFSLCYMPEGLGRPIAFFIAIAAFGLIGPALSGSLAMAVNATIAIVIAALVAAAVLRLMPPIHWRPTVRTALSWRWRKEAWQLVLLAIFTNFFADICILATAPFLSRTDTAVLGLCLKLAFLAGYFVQIGQQMAVPDMADAHHAGDERRLWQAAWRSIKLPSALSGLTLLAVVVAGPRLLSVFGPDFPAGATALAILVAAQLWRALAGPGVHLLTLHGNQTINMALALSSLGVLYFASALLGPRYGITGGAIAVLLVQCYWSAANVAILRHLRKPTLDLAWVVLNRREIA